MCSCRRSTNIAQRVQEPNRELDSAFVGASKDKLDFVDCDMCVAYKPINNYIIESVDSLSRDEEILHRRNTLQTGEYLALGTLSRILNNAIVRSI